MLDLSTPLCNCIICGKEGEPVNFKLNNYISYFKDPYRDAYVLNFCQEAKHPSFRTEFLYPIKEGTFADFEVLEFIVQYLFKYKIYLSGDEEKSILFIEPYNFKKEDREKISQLFFEEYYFDKVFMINPSILTLLNEGKFTGTVAELDYDMSSFIPIFDCYSLPHAIIRSNIGRKDINDYFEKLVREDYSNKNIKDISNKLVTEACYISLDYFNEIDNVEQYYYRLPDNEGIYIKNPRIQSPEILFRPSLNNLTDRGDSIAKSTNNSIIKCDEDLYNELYNNIVLTGINSQFKGMKERMEKEIIELTKDQFKNEVKVTINEKGIQKGVETFFSNSSFDSWWITKKEYDENGYYYDNITSRKCF